MPVLLLEESSSAGSLRTAGAPGKWMITLITEGQGSSGYYPAEVLERDGATVFPANTKIYGDHPTEEELYSQPERSIYKVIGYTTEAATYNPTIKGLEAPAFFGSAYVPMIEEFGSVLGMSIRSRGESEVAEVAGQAVDKITKLVPGKGTSVDVVTDAGRGGEIKNRIESVRREGLPPVPVGPPRKGNNMELTKEDFEKGNVEMTKAIVAGISTALTEALKPKETEPVNPVDLGFALAEALADAGLPPKALGLVKSLTERGVKPGEAISQVKETLAESITTTDMPRPDGAGGKGKVPNAFDDFIGARTESSRHMPSDANDLKALDESFDAITAMLASGDSKLHRGVK